MHGARVYVPTENMLRLYCARWENPVGHPIFRAGQAKAGGEEGAEGAAAYHFRDAAGMAVCINLRRAWDLSAIGNHA